MRCYGAHLRLASILKKNLHEIMGWEGPTTHRQFVVWSYWMIEEWNHPSRTDHYLMQLTREVRCVLDKPSRHKIEDNRLIFGKREKSKESLDNSQPDREELDREETDGLVEEQTEPEESLTPVEVDRVKYTPPKKMSKQEQITALSKSIWMARVSKSQPRPQSWQSP